MTTIPTVTERRLGWVTVDGQEYPRARAADWVQAVEMGLCPFCGAGPFQVVAIHTCKRHGIDRRALRDLLGVTYSTSITHPEYHARRQAITLNMIAAGTIGKGRPNFGKGSGPAPRFSEAAKRRLRQLNRDRSEESRKAGGRTLSENRREANQRRDAGIVEALRRGDPNRQIMDRFGVSPPTVSQVARENGLLRSDRDAVAAARASLRVEAASGKSLAELADAAGVGRRVMRKRLVRAGAWPLPGGAVA